jgi:hypothetical protein
VLTRSLEGNYIKAAKVIQNSKGSMFCVCYLKDGQFKALILNKQTELHDINLSKLLKITDYIRPNDNFPYPMMECCFLKNNMLFINMFQTITTEMIMININPYTGEMIDKPDKY